jgi:CRP/FNR family transcriptional activator FtrB
VQQDEEITLKSLPLFQGISERSRDDLLQNAIVHGAETGTILFSQSDVPNFQFVVISGSAHLLGKSKKGREVLIDVVRAPELVIPAAVATGAPYLMQARVPEPSRFLLIHATIFRARVAADPALAQIVIGNLSRQFRRMVRQIKTLKLRPLTQRVGCYVLAQSARQGMTNRVQLPYEKSLIASELGITRESFSRALSSLERVGLRVEGQTIVIVDRDELTARCAPDPLIDGQDGEPAGPEANSRG